MNSPFPWLYSIFSKAVILAAGGLSLVLMGWPISEPREPVENSSEVDSQTQARDVSVHYSAEPNHEGSAFGRRVNLNQGQLKDFERLPGIGAILAQRIVNHRERHGPFQTVNALDEVSGIGDVRIEGLRPLVIVSSD